MMLQRLEGSPPARHVLGMLLLAALWFGVCKQLWVEWSINPQYSYGWGVPLLALYLGWERWKDRPAAESRLRIPALGAMILVLAFLLLPVRLVQEANPDWRLVSLAGASLVVALTLAFLGGWGGRAWMRHFAVAAGFMLLAVPWPTPVETLVTQSLMRGLAAITVEAVNWCGVPAVRLGNLIHLNNGVIGINEACSGVRSFQGTLMAAVFLGELYRLSAVRRGWLLGGSLVVALALNLGRALLLTWLTIGRGIDAAGQWHDPAGYLVLGAAFALLWLLTLRLRSPCPVASAAPVGLAGPHALPAGWLIGLALWLPVVEGGTDAWYRAHERALPPARTWRVRWPVNEPGFRFQEVHEDVRRLLRYSFGEAATWRREGGVTWSLFWFRWAPGRAAAQLARAHSPEICLPAGGLKPLSEHGQEALQVRGLDLPFKAYLFEAGGRPLTVFYCLWEDRPPPSAGQDGLAWLSRRSRFRAVASGQRHLGQVMFEVAISGLPNVAQARQALAAFLKDAVEVSEPR